LLSVYKHKFEKIAGWESLEVDTPEKLYSEVLKNAPDLILTDIMLKNGSAYEVIELIKKSENKKIASTPIIILTDLSQAEDRREAKKLGASEYLVKTETSFNQVVEKVKSFNRK